MSWIIQQWRYSTQLLTCDFNCKFTIGTLSQAGMLPVPLKMGMAVQLLVFLGILASTVTITRSVVQGTLPSISKGMEHLQEKKHSECFSPLPGDNIIALDHTELQGYIVSNRERRYNNSKQVLDKLGIQAHQYVPLSYQSEQIHDAMILYHNGSTKYHTDTYKKVFSNRMAFTDLFQKFVDDRRARIDSWRFFFEDDVQLHPDLNDSLAQEVLAKGMKVAAGDGIMYLGICGPKDCQDRTKLSSNIEASRCWGSCTHAFALTKWKTAGFLSYMDQLKTVKNPDITSMYFDQLMRSYGIQVHKIWVLGSNLKSLQQHNHYGLLFQDRTHFPSVINSEKKKPKP